MKWPDALLKPTREYTGGILAGLGLGLLVAEMIARRSDNAIPWIVSFLGGFALIAIGSTIAQASQRSQKKKEKPANQPIHGTAGGRP